MRKLLVLLLLAPCALLAQVPDYVPTDGLVAWYPMNGNALDESGNGLDGNLNGPSLTEDRFGLQAALHFDGTNDHILVPHNDQLSFANNTMTLAMWVRIDALPAENKEFQTVMKVNGWGASTMGYQAIISWNAITTLRAKNGSASAWMDTGTTVNWDFGTYTHIAYSLTDTLCSTFINGVLADSQVPDNTIIGTNQEPLILGWNNPLANTGASIAFSGDMDDVGFWNRALTEQEIQALFLNTEPLGGCTDSEACNFNPEASIDDSTCDYGCLYCGPGTHWDSTLAVCVADVPGAEVAENCALMSLQELSQGYLNLLETVSLQDSLLNVCQGDTASSGGSTDPATDPTAWSCGDPLPYQGYDYATVQIGEQCWFAENCRHLPSVSAPSNLGTLELDTLPRAFVYDYSGSAISEAATTTEYANYGAMYNWAASENWEICPTGWHIPTDVEWQSLESNMGMSTFEVNDIGWQRGHEDALGIGLQTNGFQISSTGGFVHHTLGFLDENDQAFYWSSTLDESNTSIPGPIFHRRFSQNHAGVYRGSDFNQNSGAYVRCVKD